MFISQYFTESCQLCVLRESSTGLPRRERERERETAENSEVSLWLRKHFKFNLLTNIFLSIKCYRRCHNVNGRCALLIANVIRYALEHIYGVASVK